VENPENYQSNIWEIRDIKKYLPREYWQLDSNRRAKWFKLHPHKLFGKEYDRSIWIDGSVETKQNLGNLAKSINRWGVFKHFQRNCILEEAYVCAQLGLDHAELMRKQVAYYLTECKYPIRHGLAENTVIIRNHNDRRVKSFCGRWWEEIRMWSKRDQLSFNYCAWKLHLKYQTLEGTVYQNDWFRVFTHAH